MCISIFEYTSKCYKRQFGTYYSYGLECFFFPKISTWLTSSPPLDLCPNDTLAVELLQKALPPKPSLSSCPTFFYLEHFLSSDMPCDLLITFCISLLLLRCQVLEGRSCIYPFCSWLCQQQLEHTFNILESNK